MDKIKFVLRGIPQAKQSMQVARLAQGKFRKYQPSKVVSYQNFIKMQMIDQLPKGFIPFHGNIIIKKLIFKFPPLKAWPKWKLKLLDEGTIIHKNTKPDIDNLIKSWGDSGQGIIWSNDAQICQIDKIAKIFSREPGIEFEVSELEEVKKQ